MCLNSEDDVCLHTLQGAVNFKFGVIYAKAGQRADDDMYCNGELIHITLNFSCLNQFGPYRQKVHLISDVLLLVVVASCGDI